MLICLATAVLALAAQSEPLLALKGYDPVALCEGAEIEGEPDLVADHGRCRYRFVSEESLATNTQESGTVELMSQAPENAFRRP